MANIKGTGRVWRRLTLIASIIWALAIYTGAPLPVGDPAFAPATAQAAAGRTARHPRYSSRRHWRTRSAARRSFRRSTRDADTSDEKVAPQPADSDDGQIDSVPAKPEPVTVTILAGTVDGTATEIAAEISNVLDSDDMRVMTVLGKGSVQNLRDITASPYLDVTVVPADALDQAKALGLGDLLNEVSYIAPLYMDEVHILARGDLATIGQLEGKRVGVDIAGSSTADRSALIFNRLGIKPEMINMDQATALQQLKRGALDAVIFADGKPVPELAALPQDSGLHFVAIPYEPALQDIYLPAKLGPKDYPNLIKLGASVDTVAIGTLLAVYDAPAGSPRYRKLAKFTDAFFEKFDEFHKPGHHPKWEEVNFAADVPKWKRFKPAEDWLAQSDHPDAAAAAIQ